MHDSKYQIGVYSIIGMEFCERLSFGGLRTILSLFLRNELLIEEHNATIYYHIFIMVCFIIPIVGAICADSILGRYRTIIYFSIVYFIGNILLTISAIPSMEVSPKTFTVVSLILVAIGAGGVKPCVAAFGGDQFLLPTETNLLQNFFSMFYFAINLGGFIGMILTPILRKAVTCFGEDTCYPLGFGFPSILALLAILLFYMGKPWYRMKKPKENVILKFLNCTIYALLRKVRSREKKNHWLDYASEKFETKLISDMKIVYAVFLLYTPLPIFWSLFDQQGSRWTFQASRMEGTFFGKQIVPDQMQVINPAMVLVLIPIFDQIVYPFFTKLDMFTNPLFRMAIGGLIAGLAFLSAGILELILERNYPEFPGKHEATINFINTLPCDIILHNPFNGMQKIDASELFRFRNVYARNFSEYKIAIETPNGCGGFNFMKGRTEQIVVAIEFQSDIILIGVNQMKQPRIFIADPVDFTDYLSGRPIMRVAYMKTSHELRNITVNLRNIAGLTDIYFVPDDIQDSMATSAYMELPDTGYEYFISSTENSRIFEDNIHLALGGVYLLAIVQIDRGIQFSKLYTIFPPNYVNIIWLLPQYFLISIAEIMFGIAGLEFSFTQAPKSMKTVSIAAWYLSVALGNFIVIIITKARLFRSQAYEFFLFAFLIVADMMVFSQMASKYNFVQLEADTEFFETQPLLKDTETNEN